MQPGEDACSLVRFDEDSELLPLRPTIQLGPKVIADGPPDMHGRVQIIRWNPLEGSSNGPMQVCMRGNMDCQSMLRTLGYGFTTQLRDELREAPFTDADILKEQRRRDATFESKLPTAIQKMQAEQKKKRLLNPLGSIGVR